jgi:hypothetical protein
LAWSSALRPSSQSSPSPTAQKPSSPKINSYGASVVTVTKMPQTFITIEEYLSFQKRRDITYDDYRAILDDCRSCESVGAQRNNHRQSRLPDQFHHGHQRPRLDLDHAPHLQSQYRSGPLLH